MKILKPGKVEQRKFVCPNCECEFVVDKTEMMWTIYGLRKCCPTCCQSIDWEFGEPYEEPTPTQTDRERLTELLMDGDLVEELKRMCRHAYLQRRDF